MGFAPDRPVAVTLTEQQIDELLDADEGMMLEFNSEESPGAFALRCQWAKARGLDVPTAPRQHPGILAIGPSKS